MTNISFLVSDEGGHRSSFLPFLPLWGRKPPTIMFILYSCITCEVCVKAKYEIIVALIVLATQGSTQIILWGNSLLLLLLQKKKKNMLSSRQQRHSASAPCRNILTNESFRLFFLNKMGNEIKNWNTSNLERNDLDFLLLHYCIRRFLLNNLSRRKFKGKKLISFVTFYTTQLLRDEGEVLSDSSTSSDFPKWMTFKL